MTKMFLITLPKHFFFNRQSNPYTVREQYRFAVPVLMATSLRPLYGCDFTAVGEGAGSVRETESFIAHGRVWEHCETA